MLWCGRVQKGSRFSFSGAEGFTFLVHLCWRCPKTEKNLVFRKCVFLTWLYLKKRIFGRRQHYRFLAALRCQRVQLFSGRFAIIVLGRRRVHDFRPNALEGSLFSSSGAEGFTVFDVMRRRVHVLGARVPKGSRFSLSCAEGFTF